MFPIASTLFRPAAWALAAACVALPRVQAGTIVLEQPGAGGNRIEVRGNEAHDVQLRCAPGGTAQGRVDVNSVQVDPRALRGRTVTVTGQNSRDQQVEADCAQGRPPAANVNSVTIR